MCCAKYARACVNKKNSGTVITCLYVLKCLCYILNAVCDLGMARELNLEKQPDASLLILLLEGNLGLTPFHTSVVLMDLEQFAGLN